MLKWHFTKGWYRKRKRSVIFSFPSCLCAVTYLMFCMYIFIIFLLGDQGLYRKCMTRREMTFFFPWKVHNITFSWQYYLRVGIHWEAMQFAVCFSYFYTVVFTLLPKIWCNINKYCRMPQISVKLVCCVLSHGKCYWYLCTISWTRHLEFAINFGWFLM